jgi:hypothetical protein
MRKIGLIELREYLKDFPKDVLVTREQAELAAKGGFPNQLKVWGLWDEYDRLKGMGK